MSEETKETSEGQEIAEGDEPSMEEILTSIRKILSEDEEEALAAEETG